MGIPQTGPDDTTSTTGPSPHRQEVLRLAELLHQVDISEQKEVALQNLVNHMTKHFDAELLPMLDRLSKWDTSGASTVFHARIALQKNQVKLAERIIEPLLAASGAPDVVLLLGARIHTRTGEHDRARQLLRRIPAGSPLEQVIRDVEGKLEAAIDRKASAAKAAPGARA